MPYKEGGGGKQQPYDDDNGEYVRNPQCEEDEKNLVFIKMFGLKTNKPIAFPKFGIHDKDYCELYLSYCVDFKTAYIEEQKIKNYLLRPQDVDDKSNFFNLLGYNLSNWQELEKQILKGTDFKNRDCDITNFGVKIVCNGAIYNSSKTRKYNIICVWHLTNNCPRLVTVRPIKEK